MKLYIAAFELFRDNRVCKTQSGKSGCLGKAAKLDGTGFCTFTLIDGYRNIFFCNISFVSSIVDDDCTCFVGIIYPNLKLFFCDRLAGRVVREAQIDDIRSFFWQFRTEIVFCGTRHVDHITPGLTFRIISAGSSCHNVGIHINRVNRITYRNFIIQREYFLNICRIALCTIRYKNLICCDVTSVSFVIILCDRLTQKCIAKIRCITFESLCCSLLINCFVQCFDHGRCDRLCHITDTQTDDLCLWIRCCKCIDFFRDCGKKIASR